MRSSTAAWSGSGSARISRFTDQTLEGGLAAAWEQPDPQSLSFRLRPGVRFQDKGPLSGRQLTAADVKFSLDRLLASPFAFLSYYESIRSVETPDSQTVVLKLKAPDAALLLHLAAGYAWVIAPEAGKADAKSAAGLDFHDPSTAIGTGPFLLESDREGAQSSFIRNPIYFEAGLPYVDRLIFRFIPDPSAAIASLESGQSTVAQIPHGSEVDFRARNPHFGYATEYDTQAWHHAMRTDRPPFNDVRVRRALALAWNQDEVKRIKGYADAPSSFGSLPAIGGDAYLPLQQLGDNARWWKPDLTQARQLLAAAGYPQGFEADYNDSDCCAPDYLAEQLAADLAKIGVKLNIRVKAQAAYLGSTARGQYDGMAGAKMQVFDPGDWFRIALLPDSPANVSHVDDPTVTDLVRKQAVELDTQKRLAIFHVLDRFLAGQVYQLVMPQSFITDAWQPSVHGYSPRPGFQPSFAVTWLDA